MNNISTGKVGILKIGFGLLLWVLSVSMAYAQPTPSGQCPAPGTNWVPCKPVALAGTNPIPPGYQYRPQQDCCGALALCAGVNTVNNFGTGPTVGFNAFIYGDGCKGGELPTASCLGTNERQTTWYVFEIRPQPGFSSVVGSPAGKLRFKILPCDVPPNAATCTTTCNCDNVSGTNFLTDGGTNGIGATDYDFALFRVTSFAENRFAACAAIKTTSNVGTAGSIQVSCNYSGTPGPTGLFEPGNTSTGGNRYNIPLDVKVGDRFILAVDNFSINPKGYKIIFNDNPANANGINKSAIINPPAGKLDLRGIIEDTVYCATDRIKIKFSKIIARDSVASSKFRIVNLDSAAAGKADSLLTIVTVTTNTVGSASDSIFNIVFNGGTPGAKGRYVLRQIKIIRDLCGNAALDTSINFSINKFLSVSSVRPSICADSSIQITASLAKKLPVPVPPANATFKWSVLDNNNAWQNITSTSALDSVYFGVASDKSRIRYKPGKATSRYKVKFRVSVLLANGCQDTAYHELIAKPLPVVRTNNNNPICYGDTLRINADTLAMPAFPKSRYSYTWTSRTQDAILTAAGNTGPKIKFRADSVLFDSLDLAVYDSATGCRQVFPKIAGFAIGHSITTGFDIDTTGVVGAVYPLSVTLRNLSKVVPATDSCVTYIWDFGDGTPNVVVNNRKSIKHTFLVGKNNKSDDYNIRLFAIDCNTPTLTCQPVSNKPLTIFSEAFPNVITPNGDGINDNFSFRGLSKELDIVIFNRWGQKVYDQRVYADNFDAKDLPAGSYFYQVYDRVLDKKLTGWINILK